jgi:uncharacterized protein YbaR (Trm112 family)
MIHRELVAILVCPTDHTPLRIADNQLVARLNRAIAAGGAKNRAGRPLEQPLVGGLVRADNTLLYPIVDDIPVLLADEAIPLAQIRSQDNA